MYFKFKIFKLKLFILLIHFLRLTNKYCMYKYVNNILFRLNYNFLIYKYNHLITFR